MDKKSPEPTLADHGATMAMLLEDAGDDRDLRAQKGADAPKVQTTMGDYP